jgi:hypothetical protein
MKLALPTLISRLNEERRVESDGFYDGAHGTSCQIGLDEIDAKFDEKKAHLQRDAIANQKILEAEIMYLDQIRPEVERMAQAVEESNNGRVPNLVLPICIVGLAVVALIAEALLLAPAMDIFNIASQGTQLFTAIGIAGIAGLAFHFVWESLTSETFPRIWRITCRVVAGILVLGLIAWGILRGFQVGFAATLAENPLGEFLSSHAVLSSIFFVFITLATPVIAATATHFGSHALQQWWELRKARKQFAQLAKKRADAGKQLESQLEVLQLGLKALDQERTQWTSIYAIHHQRGQTRGSIQEPYWMVPAKATFAALLALLAAGWFIFVMSPFFVVFPTVVWWAAFLHYRRQWRTPSRVEFYELERVEFEVHAKDEQLADKPMGQFGRVQQALKEESH